MIELTADNLHLWRGEQHVLRGISFELPAGHCLQVTGANGSGKTTLLRALGGLVALEEGRVLWRGGDVTRERAAFHAQLDYLGHDNALKADLTVAENLRFLARLKRPVRDAEVAAALERTGVAECADSLPRHLSAGQRRRAALARLLLTRGQLWLLDEPSANLDARGHRLVVELLAEQLASGASAVVATHQALQLPATQLLPLALQ